MPSELDQHPLVQLGWVRHHPEKCLFLKIIVSLCPLKEE